MSDGLYFHKYLENKKMSLEQYLNLSYYEKLDLIMDFDNRESDFLTEIDFEQREGFV